MSASSRAKGISGEREALKALGDELGKKLYRDLTQARNGGADCLLVEGFAIEVKRRERLALPEWWRQAVRQASDVGSNIEPMVLYRQNGKPWSALIHNTDGTFRHGTLAEAAGVIREKWAVMAAEKPVLVTLAVPQAVSEAGQGAV